jgi:hypothetical protein
MKCGFVTCDRPIKAKGLCQAHYKQLLRGSELKPLRMPAGDSCSFHGCDRQGYAKGLCQAHYNQRWQGLNLTPIKARGSGYLNPKGYRVLSMPDHPNAGSNGKIFEHVVVMSEAIGRPLTRAENVHHRNGDRSDNRLENLELWSTSQPSGQRVVDKIQWARELLALYDGLDLP